MRPPISTVKWESANFFTQTVQTVAADGFTVNSVELLKIKEHYGAAGAFRQLEQVTRRIEIGGLVFNYGNRSIESAAQGAAGGQLYFGQYLVLDRLSAGGIGVALPDWTVVQGPVSVAPAATTEEVDFPTRVLWRDNDAVFPGLVTTSPVNNSMVHPSRTVNIRVRRFLDDLSGLYIQHFAKNVAAAATYSYIQWTWGTIYYRYVIGR